MQARTLFFPIALVCAGGIGWWARPDAPPRETAAPTMTSPPAPITVHARQSLRADDIRDIVRSEIAQARTTEPAPVLDEAAEQRSNNAHAKAHTLVDNIKHARRIGPEDAEQLRAQFHQMTDEQRQDIASALLPAINRQEIRVELDGPIF